MSEPKEENNDSGNFLIDVIDLGSVPCACGCGEEAVRFYRGIPVSGENPQDHYDRYLANKALRIQQEGYTLPLGVQIRILRDRRGRGFGSLAQMLAK